MPFIILGVIIIAAVVFFIIKKKSGSDGNSENTKQVQKFTESAAEVGSYIKFGNYIQNGKSPEPVEWLVLENTGSSALLISKYALDCKKYNETFTDDISWETCSLRKWLNGEFLNTLFTDTEQAQIADFTLSSDGNPDYSITSGNAETDKIFLLSIEEAEKYFSSDLSRRCALTDYVIKHGADVSSCFIIDNKPTGWWWLRSPGKVHGLAAHINADGTFNSEGEPAIIDHNTVRPALRINL